MRRKNVKIMSGWGVELTLVAGLAFAVCGVASLAHADDLQMIRNIGDGYKSVRVITRYEIHPDTKSFDLYAAEPAVPTGSKAIEAEIAGQTAQEICTGGRMTPGWTVRIFLPGNSVPATSCRAGGRSHSHRRTHEQARAR